MQEGGGPAVRDGGSSVREGGGPGEGRVCREGVDTGPPITYQAAVGHTIPGSWTQTDYRNRIILLLIMLLNFFRNNSFDN